jgi:hypothetical protein
MQQQDHCGSTKKTGNTPTTVETVLQFGYDSQHRTEQNSSDHARMIRNERHEMNVKAWGDYVFNGISFEDDRKDENTKTAPTNR